MADTRDPYEKPVKDHEYLTWTDSIRARLKGYGVQRDTRTGETYNPQRRYLEERAQERKREAEEKARREREAQEKGS